MDLTNLDLWAVVTQLLRSLDLLGVALLATALAPELLLPLVGFLVFRGEFGFWGALLAATAGAMLGQWAIYLAARAVGEARLLALSRRYGRLLSERDVRRVLALSERFGAPLVLFGRAIPTLRSLVSVPAGLRRMPLGRFSVFTALGTGSWKALLLYAGTLLGRNWRQVTQVLQSYSAAVWVLLALAVAGLVVRRLGLERV